MEHLDASLLYLAHLVAQAREVGREDGWDNLEHVNYSICALLARFLQRWLPRFWPGAFQAGFLQFGLPAPNLLERFDGNT
jgi:hypothetical protein